MTSSPFPAAALLVSLSLAACEPVPEQVRELPSAACLGRTTGGADAALAVAREHIDRHGVPGAAFAIVRDGQLEALGALGSRSAGICEPIGFDTRFSSYLGVHLTAAATAEAVAAGELDLDAPLTDVVPDFRVAPPGDASAITLRHVLSHTSGYGREGATGCASLDDWFGIYDGFPLWAPPGETYLWAPVHASLAGRALASTERDDFEGAMHRWLFAPLGLDTTYDPIAALKGDFAAGFVVVDDGLAEIGVDTTRCGAKEPYRGAFASIRDTGAFLTWLAASDTGAELRDDAGSAFFAPERTTLSSLLRGPLTEDRDWWFFDVHGSGYGYAIRVLDSGLAVAVLVNASHGAADQLANALIALYDDDARPSFAGQPPDPRNFAGLVGTFRDPLAGRTLQVTVEGETLTAELVGRADPVPLTPAFRHADATLGYADDVFDLSLGSRVARLRFWRTDDGIADIVSEETIRQSLGPPLLRIQ